LFFNTNTTLLQDTINVGLPVYWLYSRLNKVVLKFLRNIRFVLRSRSSNDSSFYNCAPGRLLRDGLTFTVNGWLGHLNLRIVSLPHA
jgi:hypothetical protein